jgi:hypothetical protein
MKRRRSTRVVVAMVATMMLLAIGGGSAQAVFPNFSGCTITDPENEACIDIQNRRANMSIKGFNIPLGESLEIRGQLRLEAGGRRVFYPPAGTNGFFGRAVPIPGGIFGIEWLPGNTILAITELAGPSSAIEIDVPTQTIRVPIKVRLVNLLLGMDCHIGTNSRPIVFRLIVGTTSPPPPNTPISGRLGRFTIFPEYTIAHGFLGNVNVENSYAVPGATECGLGLGLINSLVNLRLRLPSAAGNNSVEIVSDVAIGTPN